MNEISIAKQYLLTLTLAPAHRSGDLAQIFFCDFAWTINIEQPKDLCSYVIRWKFSNIPLVLLIFLFLHTVIEAFNVWLTLTYIVLLIILLFFTLQLLNLHFLSLIGVQFLIFWVLTTFTLSPLVFKPLLPLSFLFHEQLFLFCLLLEQALTSWFCFFCGGEHYNSSTAQPSDGDTDWTLFVAVIILVFWLSGVTWYKVIHIQSLSDK